MRQAWLSWAAALSVAVVAAGCFIDSDDNDGDSRLFEGCEENSDCTDDADACYIVKWTETTGQPREGKMCSLECMDDDDCPLDSSCYQLEEDVTLRRVCYGQCERDSDCDVGFACYHAEIEGGGEDFICMPR